MGGLLGRDIELDRLHHALRRLLDGTGGVLCVTGESGSGRTALLAAFAELAGDAGCQVHAGVAGPPEPTGSVRPAGPDATPGNLDEWGLGGGPVVVILDDIQDADDASLAAWQHWRRRTGRLAVLLVAVFGTARRRPLVAALLRPGERGGVETVQLRPLGAEHTGALAQQWIGGPAGPRLRTLIDGTAGNPGYLRDLADALHGAGQLHDVDGYLDVTQPMLPDALVSSMLRRVDRISPVLRHLLQHAAVLGEQFTVLDLSMVVGDTPTALSPAIHEAVEAGLLYDANPRLAFRSRLVRQALYEALPEAERERRHRHAAQALAQGGACVEQVCEQLLSSTGPLARWVPAWIAGAGGTVAGQAPELARRLLSRLTREDADLHLRGRLLSVVLFRVGIDPETERLAGPVLAAHPDPAGRAELSLALAGGLAETGRGPAAVPALDDVLALPDLPVAWRARLGALRASIVLHAGDPETGAREGRRALALGRDVADGQAVGQSLEVLARAASVGGRCCEALRLTGEALTALGEDRDHVGVRLHVLRQRAGLLLMHGRPEDGEAAVGKAVALAEHAASARVGDQRAAAARHNLGRARWTEAVDHARAIPDAAQRPALETRDGVLALAALWRDDDADAAELLLGRLKVAGESATVPSPVWRQAHAALAADRGRPLEALGWLTGLLNPGSGEVDHQYLWLADIVRLACAVGDLELARAATEASAANPCGALPRQAAAEHCAGLSGRDPVLIRVAADHYAESGLAGHAALAHQDVALLYAEQGEPTLARQEWKQTVERLRALDARGPLRTGAQALGRLGVRPGGVRRPDTGWSSLTRAELSVARLVGLGHGNAAIATVLHLSRRTVETHVSHIKAKLDAQSRIDVARQWAIHEPAPVG